jgi:hypothetical protein
MGINYDEIDFQYKGSHHEKGMVLLS